LRGDSERTGRLILLDTQQELERSRVAKSTWTIKKWMKIMKLVQNVGVIGEVERKYFTLHGFQLPFPISFTHPPPCPSPLIRRNKSVIHFQTDTASVFRDCKLSQASCIKCDLWCVLPDVSNDQFPLAAGRSFAASGTERPITQSNIPEDSTSRLTHSTAMNSLLLIFTIITNTCTLFHLAL